MSPKKENPKPSTAAAARKRGPFTDAERLAMKEHVEEFKREARGNRGTDKADGDGEVLARIAAMPEADRAMGERLHAIIMASGPGLVPRLWYGMPAYSKNGNVVCFYQNAGKFKARYGTLGFSDKARLDDGTMWPTSFALAALTTADEARIAALVKKAAG